MSDKFLIDSNIIVYAYDKNEPAKQSIAQKILTSAIKEEFAILSVQVLGEFFVVVTRRIKNPLSVYEAEKIVNILATLPVSEIDLLLVKRAIETQKEYGISYWDSLIMATAERAGCSKVLSEDLNEGQIYNNVIVENPFNLTEEG
jgi:predicted nucleic acid-binding protein